MSKIFRFSSNKACFGKLTKSEKKNREVLTSLKLEFRKISKIFFGKS